MMKTFERPMRKDFDKKGKLKQYIISLGVKSEINEDRFHENQNGKMVCDVIVCFPDEYQKFSDDLENAQSKIQSLEDEILEKNKSIERLEKELSSIYEKHDKELEDVKNDLNGQVKELKDKVHEKDIEIEKTKTKYEKKIGDLKEENLNHINDIDIFDEEKHILIKDHILEVNGIKNRIVEGLIPHNDNINQLDSISLWRFLKGDLKEVRKDLKKDIQVFQDISHYIESKNENVIVEIKKEKEDKDSS